MTAAESVPSISPTAAPVPAPLKFSGFISYSRSDETVARALHRRLESYRIPKPLRAVRDGSSRLGRFFIDREDFAAGGVLPEEIRRALASSERLIVLCSDQAATSNWVEMEISEFERIGRSDHILPVIVGGSPPICFPDALRSIDRIAADFRSEADGQEFGFLKIVAGLLRVTLSELKDREAEAARARRRNLIALVVLFATLFIGSAIGLIGTLYFNHRSNELARAAITTSGEIADQALILAINSQADEEIVSELLSFSESKLEGLYSYGAQLEELRRRHAWALVRFGHSMLMSGKLDEAESYAKRAIEKVDGDSDRGALLARNGSLTVLADASLRRGKPEEALDYANRSLAVANEYRAARPDYYQTRLVLAETLAQRGEAQNALGQTDEALSSFLDAIRYLRELYLEQPESATFPLLITKNALRVTDIYRVRNDAGALAEWSIEASRMHLAFLGYNKGRVAHHQRAVELGLTAAKAMQAIGNQKGVLEALGHAEESMAWLAEIHPDNAGITHNLSRARSMRAIAEAGEDPFEAATTPTPTGVDALTPEEIAEEGALLSRAEQAADRADAMAEAGNADSAAKELETAIALLRRIRARGGHSVESESLFASTLTFGAAIAVDRGESAKARKWFAEAEEAYETLARRDPSNPTWKEGAKIARSASSGLD